MRFTTDLAACTWTVPVPVKRSRFAAMDPSHDVHNVETDLAAIVPFALDPARPTPPLLHADLQTLPFWNAERRLGSGRAGCHQGAYLKGVGRTPLAANWADPDDRYHGTGHMLPSAAVREYLVSRALDARGAGHTIVPCVGLLAAELERPGDAMLAAMLPAAVGRFATADHRMQALTVKPADFARLSNFLWAFCHLGAPTELGPLLHRWHHYLLPPEQRTGRASATSPEAIATALAASVERATTHFGQWVDAGVYWGSLSNNLTADGRFLDLEVPMLLLRPFFGVVCEDASSWNASNWFGLEVFSYLRETQAFVTALRERVRFLAQHVFVRGVGHEFLGELALELDEQLGEEHILWSRDAIVDAATAAVVDALGLDGARAQAVRGIAERQYAFTFEDARPDWSDLDMRRLDVRFAPPEPGRERACAYPAFLHGIVNEGLDAGRLYNDGLRWIDASATPAELFERTRTIAVQVDDVLSPPLRKVLP
jgi:hypothetical protein